MKPAQPAVLARALAAQAVTRVLADGRYLDTALAELRRGAASEASHWPLVQELSYGTLRWYHELRGIAAVFLTRPLKDKDVDLHALLLLGLYQLRHMHVREYAAVDATVAAAETLRKPWAKALLNACLRSYLRGDARVASAMATSEEMRYSHPQWLIDALRRANPDNWEAVLAANNERPPMTLRVNVARISRADYLAQLHALGLHAHVHESVESAVVLHEPIAVEQLPGFVEGRVSVQDAAAQLAAIWLDAEPGERVLDACAAPGGKAAHLLEHGGGTIELTALDADPDRLDRVRATLARLELHARLVAADAGETASWWDGRAYDRILVDAPCSATGVIRRHPDVKVRRRPEDLPKLVQTQARILDGVWPCLAPGGKLMYATCSILGEENEQQVRNFIARHRDAVAEPVENGANIFGRQILPGENEMDGFYYALLRKT